MTQIVDSHERTNEHEKPKLMKAEGSTPKLNRLQFVVLKALGAAQISGKDLRTNLLELGIKKSGPAFYQMMARLEDAKYVKGTYRQQIIDGQIIKERLYEITGDGVWALRRTYDDE